MSQLATLSQDTKLRTEDLKVKDVLYQSIEELIHMRDKLKEYEDKMSLATPKNLDKLILKYTTLQDNFISLGGYEIDERVGRSLKDLNSNDYSIPNIVTYQEAKSESLNLLR